MTSDQSNSEQVSKDITYPKFLQNKPCGIDKLEGASQKRLAQVIASHFRLNDSPECTSQLPRIIGIDGPWGAGKSNLVTLLEKELEEEYYFFTYDAWGNQEDLQRRSILEQLTSDLIKHDFLKGETTIKIKGGGKKNVTWPEKLKYLLARKTETISEKYPLISLGVVNAFIVAILTPISTYIATLISPSNPSIWYSILSVFVASLPLLGSLIFWLFQHWKDPEKYGIKYFLALYQDKVENEICYETLSEEEPTVVEFKSWMDDISDYIENNEKHKKLVLVFDNMDRLPAEKVKELWSSIHTFFADKGFKNIWAIIPFDKTHLACAFGDTETAKAEILTQYFINKTFPIVYRVAPPVITDYKKLISKLFSEAFGQNYSKEEEIINRLFRISYPEANIRNIITFINEIVALKLEWGNDINLTTIAVFCIQKNVILKNPIKQILSGAYLNEIRKIITNDIQLQREMSALVYGVDIEIARQIPLKQYISSCINGEKDYNINLYSDTNRYFDEVLEDIITEIDNSQIDKVIKCLSLLKRKNTRISSIWERIVEIKIKESIEKQEFTFEYKQLILHVNQEAQNKIIRLLLKKLQRFNDFSSIKYYKSIKDIEQFIDDNKLAIDLNNFIEEKTVSPVLFIDFLNASVENDKISYKQYKISTKSEDLDEYLNSLLPDKFKHSTIVEAVLEDDSYQFPKLIEGITNSIKLNKINELNIGQIFKTYRLLSNKNDVLSEKLDINKAQALITNVDKTPENIATSGYYDLAARLISKGYSVTLPQHAEISEIAEIMDYYEEHGTLLINSVNWSIPLLRQVLQYCVKNRLGHKLSIAKILPMFNEIVSAINVTEIELLNHLSDWVSVDDKFINTNNITQLIPSPSFYSHTTQNDNQLTQTINNVAIEAIQQQDPNNLFSQKNNYNSNYWLVAISYLIKKINSLPENLTTFTKLVLEAIADGSLGLNPLPKIYHDLIEKFDRRKTGLTISNIRIKFCNETYKMTPSKFKILESWLRNQDKAPKDFSNTIIDTIIAPIINNDECLQLIIDNKDFYIKLLKNAGEGAYDIKQALRKKLEGKQDPDFIKFVDEVDPLTEEKTTN